LQLQIKQRKPRQSFATLQEAAKVLPHDARVINAIGEVHMALRELPAARKKFEQALAIDAKLDLALFNLASVFRAQKKLKQALAKYLELKARNDAFPGLHAGLGGVYVDLGQGKEAAAAYDKALLTVLPKDVALRLAAGRGYILVRAWEKALHQANQVLLIDSTIADARALRAEARTIENDYGEALVEIQRAISRRKKSRYFVIYARILERLRRLADAVEAYRQALKLAPKRIDLRLHRARLQVRGGAVKDAIKELKRIVREKPKLAEAHLFMGIALADLGKEAKAKAAYQRALVYKPGLGEAHFKLGQIYYDANDNSAAFKHLQAASKAASKDARWWSNALFLLAQVAERLKKKPAAIAAYKQVVKIASAGDSNRTLAIKALKRLGAWINPDD